MDDTGTEQFAVFVLGASTVAVGLLGLTGTLFGAGAASIALLALSLGRHRSDTERARSPREARRSPLRSGRGGVLPGDTDGSRIVDQILGGGVAVLGTEAYPTDRRIYR